MKDILRFIVRFPREWWDIVRDPFYSPGWLFAYASSAGITGAIWAIVDALPNMTLYEAVVSFVYHTAIVGALIFGFWAVGWALLVAVAMLCFIFAYVGLRLYGDKNAEEILQ